MSEDVGRLIDRAFASVPEPMEDEVCSSYGEEAEEETAPFRGRKWVEVDSSTVASHVDALLYWFHYYLPAFLKAGLQQPQADFVVDILLSLEPEEDPVLAQFTRQRWGRLDDQQIRAVDAWLRAVFPPDNTELQDALAVLRKRFWW